MNKCVLQCCNYQLKMRNCSYSNTPKAGVTNIWLRSWASPSPPSKPGSIEPEPDCDNFSRKRRITMKLNTISILDHEIDALVDNELDEVPRRELLLRLEQQPDQWRRVALAFLEAQSFAMSFTPSNREPAFIVTPRKEVAQQQAPFL